MPPLPGTAEHFARVGARYARVRERWPQRWLRRQEETALRELVRVEPRARALDAGCGDGTTLDWLARQGARGLGIDVAWPMAVTCRRRGFDVAVQDMERLGLRAAFDWVLCIGSLEFSREPGRAIAGLAACLRPRGRFALLFPRRHWLGRVYAAYHRSHGVRIGLFTCAQVAAWMRAAGLHPLAWRDCALSTLCVAAAASPADENRGR